jgi:hypothetical protein
MALSKVVDITSVEYAPNEYIIRATEITSVIEDDVLLSSSIFRLVYNPSQKQEAIDYGNADITAMANHFFTDTVVANWDKPQAGGNNPADIPADIPA